MRQTALGENLRKVEAELAAGRPEQALALCQETQSRYPRALAVWRVLGEVYLTLRKPREALGALERALAGDPEDARALCARAIVHQMHGDSAAALAWYRRACDVRPDDQVLRATYHELATHLGQPSYRPSRLGLARLYLRGDLLAHALREWEALAQEHPEQMEVQMGLAEAHWRAQQPQAAEESCRRLLANAPFYVKAHVLLAALLLDRGLRDEARHHAERAAELDPEQRIAQALFADRLAAGDDALRILLFERASTASMPLASTPRATLPAEAQHLFSETEYMLWGPDDETRSRAATRGGSSAAKKVDLPPPGQSAARQPAASSPTGQPGTSTPAAQGATGGGAGLNWVQWLQAQGARPLTGAPGAAGIAASSAGSSPGSSPGSSYGPTAEEVSAARSAVPSKPMRATGPLSANTEALRAMFAQLDPGGPGGRSGVTEGVVAGTSEPAGGPAGFPFDPSMPDSRGGPAAASVSGSSARASDSASPGAQPAWDSDAGAPAGWLARDDAQPQLLARADRRETETQRLAHAHALQGQPGGIDAPEGVSMEALERDFTASGFLPVEPQPGLLAAMAAGDSSITSSRVPSLGPRRVELPASVADDLPGRLRLARTWRQEGRLDDALAEYRVLIKQAPELLPELMDELHECVRQAPENPEVHRLLGDARIQQGDYLGALEAYNRAVALTHPDAL